MILSWAKRHLNMFNILKCTFCSVPTSFGEITIQKIGPVTCLGLNRPSKRNCLTPGILNDLKGALEHFEKDTSSRVAVLYGERGTFSYGYDPEDFISNPKLLEDIEEIGLLDRFLNKPVVAAVSGHALGPGFDLALWCDFRILEDTALMGGYAKRFGVPTNDIILRRMYSMLGLNKTMDLVLTGRIFTAKEAQDCGIATRVVACGSGLGQGVSFAHALANVPQACLKADRAALLSLSQKYSPQTKNLILEEMNSQRLSAVKEAKEGIHLTQSGDVREKRS